MQVKDTAFASMCEDLTKGKALLEGWQKARMEQLLAQQKREVEALLQRSCLQRDELELELKRTLELHDKRCNAVVAVRTPAFTILWQFFVFVPWSLVCIDSITAYF